MHPQPSPGAIHLRTAVHPWGRRSNDRTQYTGWSSPEPVLDRETAAEYLACPDQGRDALPGCLSKAETIPNAPDSPLRCVAGAIALGVQNDLSGNQIGRLYGANVIDEWTRDRTAEVRGLGEGERAVSIYWNASTWNPYQVVLFETELRGLIASEPR